MSEQLKPLFAMLVGVAAGGSVALIIVSILGNVLKQFPVESTNPFYNMTHVVSSTVNALATYTPIVATVLVVFLLIMPLILWLWKAWTG